MSIVDHHGEVEYPFSQKTVFKAIMEAAPDINGLSLDSADEISGRVTFKAGVSLASWGENIPVQLIKVAPTRTQMKIMSTPKTGIMFGGAMDFGKNQQNIDRIINAVSAVLANYPSETEAESKIDVAEQLTKLKQLLDQGVLTEQEFTEQKKKILDATSSIGTATSAVLTERKNEEKQAESPIRIEGSGEGNSTNYALIALVVFVVVFLLLMMASCKNQTENSAQIAEIEKKYQDSLSAVRNELKEAKSKIELLSYPADQRILKAKNLLDAGELDMAKTEIEQLKSIFPNSSEASSSNALLTKIEELKEAKRKEEERIKALGFKALPEQTTVKVDYNTVTYSSIGVGNRFIFDAYDDRWFYRDADRGSKYVTMQMSVTSTSHNPELPELALYSISGDKMILEGTFDTEFARWRDYGAYLGNYHDSSNDFSKVSTVKFKLGLQVSNEKLSKPYAIVLKKKNALSYHYDRYSNPPISYIGSAGYPSSLTLENFKNGYVLVKRYNLK